MTMRVLSLKWFGPKEVILSGIDINEQITNKQKAITIIKAYFNASSQWDGQGHIFYKSRLFLLFLIIYSSEQYNAEFVN